MTYFLHPLLFTVAQKSPKQAAVQVVQDSDQKVFIKLKRWRKLEKTKQNSFIYALNNSVIHSDLRDIKYSPALLTATRSQQTE